METQNHTVVVVVVRAVVALEVKMVVWQPEGCWFDPRALWNRTSDLQPATFNQQPASVEVSLSKTPKPALDILVVTNCWCMNG